MVREVRSLLCASVTILSVSAGAAVPSPSPNPFPDAGSKVEQGRRTLADYRWRVKTEMKIDGGLRVTKVEDVHLNSAGGLDWDKTVGYERLPPPTPVPWADPRRGLPSPPSTKEEEAYFEQAYGLVQAYAQVSASQISAWAGKAQVTRNDPEREGRTKLKGRGLAMSYDEAVVYLDAATQIPAEVEVKTAAGDKTKEIAFIRLTLEPLKERMAGNASIPVIAPMKVFLNMNRGRRRVVLEMTFSDFRKWP